MFRDLRTRVSEGRRALAWGLLGGLALIGAVFLSYTGGEGFAEWGHAIGWTVAPFLAVYLLTYLLLDPLLRQRQTATPGFARDIIVFVLYAFAIAFVLRRVGDVSLGGLLGTGAIAAAILGLSLQQTLGNLFAGLSLHLSPAFQIGDWIELSGNIRISSVKETYVGQVEAVTWRCVHLKNENGDTEIFPNLIVAQAVVTNLYAPSGLHRRTGRVVIEPCSNIHTALKKLTIALAGIPHLPTHPPEVVVVGSDMGGAVLEMRWWSLGFRSGKAAQFQAFRLATTCLPREGFSLIGPHGATSPRLEPRSLDVHKIQSLLEKMGLPVKFAADLQGRIKIRHAAPGEGVIQAGDQGDSLFWVLSGSLSMVQAESRLEPYSGVFWQTIADLDQGDWFGEASLLTGAPRRATVVASTECDLAEITKEAFETVLRSDPQIIERLANIMMSRRSPEPNVEPSTLSQLDHWRSMISAWFRLE
jgi:small-conductance mechanosensitive channel